MNWPARPLGRPMEGMRLMGYAFFKMSCPARRQDLLQYRAIDIGRKRAFAGDHRQEFCVGDFEELFILVDFVAGQGADLGIGEGTEDEVHLRSEERRVGKEWRSRWS